MFYYKKGLIVINNTSFVIGLQEMIYHKKVSSKLLSLLGYQFVLVLNLESFRLGKSNDDELRE